jgi:hypothetical protein
MCRTINSNKIETPGKPAGADGIIMTDKNENKNTGGIGSRLKTIFSSECGCGEGCCGTRIVPKDKKEGPATKEE